MTNTQLLMAALAYSQCGNWREVADSLGTLTRDGLRCAVVRASKDNPVIVSALEEGRKLSAKINNKRRTDPKQFIPNIHIRSDLAFKKDREIHKLRTSQPSPVTLGQKLLGEPVSGRSALDKIKTDGNGDITNASPRIKLNLISIPSISINNNHT